jgi:hypothetical protein
MPKNAVTEYFIFCPPLDKAAGLLYNVVVAKSGTHKNNEHASPRVIPSPWARPPLSVWRG